MRDQRDEEFTSIVVQRGAALLRTACLMTGDRQHGEDLVQTTLAKAYGSWAKVQRADEPLAYVRRIMVNSHLSWRRRLLSSPAPAAAAHAAVREGCYPSALPGSVSFSALLLCSDETRTSWTVTMLDGDGPGGWVITADAGSQLPEGFPTGAASVLALREVVVGL